MGVFSFLKIATLSAIVNSFLNPIYIKADLDIPSNCVLPQNKDSCSQDIKWNLYKNTTGLKSETQTNSPQLKVCAMKCKKESACFSYAFTGQCLNFGFLEKNQFAPSLNDLYVGLCCDGKVLFLRNIIRQIQLLDSRILVLFLILVFYFY